MSETAISEHAQKYLGRLGRIEIKNVRREAHEIYVATVVLTCNDHIEYFNAWAGDGAVAMIKTHTTPVAGLPLFERNDGTPSPALEKIRGKP
jgi:hypothetical protein